NAQVVAGIVRSGPARGKIRASGNGGRHRDRRGTEVFGGRFSFDGDRRFGDGDDKRVLQCGRVVRLQETSFRRGGDAGKGLGLARGEIERDGVDGEPGGLFVEFFGGGTRIAAARFLA